MALRVGIWSRRPRGEVEQFCSWSAWRMNKTSIARASADLLVISLIHIIEHIQQES
jgi:hypothetical protein